MMHGPPASRLSSIAKKIASHYKIHLIDTDEVMSDAVKRLERRVTEQPEEDAEDLENDKETLAELKEAAKNGGKYTASQIIMFVKEKLKSMPCKNQGYVLDGYPMLIDDATELFKRT